MDTLGKKKILIFAGTYEGRILCERLSHFGTLQIDVSVATEYGASIIEGITGVNILTNRLTKQDMIALIKQSNYDKIIDATHPFAVEVTKNIKSACEELNKDYIRLLREDIHLSDSDDIIEVSDIQGAVEVLNSTDKNALITTGSKEIALFKGVNDYDKRLYVRVLPSVEAINACHDIGIKSKNIICMQGPFSNELNVAMLKQYNCEYLVTKSTGDVGGILQKAQAVQQVGAKLIVISRPTKEQGYSIDNVIDLILN